MSPGRLRSLRLLNNRRKIPIAQSQSGTPSSARVAQITSSPAFLRGLRDPRVVLKEFVPYGIDRLIRPELENQILGRGPRTVLPALGQLLHLLAEGRERVDREPVIVRLQDVGMPFGVDELVDRLARGVDQLLCLFRREDLVRHGTMCRLQSDMEAQLGSPPGFKASERGGFSERRAHRILHPEMRPVLDDLMRVVLLLELLHVQRIPERGVHDRYLVPSNREPVKPGPRRPRPRVPSGPRPRTPLWWCSSPWGSTAP